jgi:hypothetical protein
MYFDNDIINLTLSFIIQKQGIVCVRVTCFILFY